MSRRTLALLVCMVLIGALFIEIEAKKKNKDQKKKDDKVDSQEPHWKNGEHNKDYKHTKEEKDASGWVREDDDDDDDSHHFHDQKVDEIAHKVAKCPAFDKSHGGCPYATKDGTVHLDKLKDCPAFKDGKCPYSNENMEKLKNCPAFKDGKCPFDGDHKIDLEKVKDCPAFKDGCPYDKHHKHAHGHSHGHSHGHGNGGDAAKCPFAHMHGKKTEDANNNNNDAATEVDVKGCPAFKNGCPYADMDKIDPAKLKDCPAFKDGCPYSTQDMEKVKNCPAFKNGCPFNKEGKVDFEKIKDCPAFKDGSCPFDTDKIQSLCPYLSANARKVNAEKVAKYYLVGGEDVSDLLAEDFKFLAGPGSERDRAAFVASSLKLEAVTVEDVVGEDQTVVTTFKLPKDARAALIVKFDKTDKVKEVAIYNF